VSIVFNADKYAKRNPDTSDALLGLKKTDFSNIIDELHAEGIVNNVHYDIQSGEQVIENREILRVEFINKK